LSKSQKRQERRQERLRERTASSKEPTFAPNLVLHGTVSGRSSSKTPSYEEIPRGFTSFIKSAEHLQELEKALSLMPRSLTKSQLFGIMYGRAPFQEDDQLRLSFIEEELLSIGFLSIDASSVAKDLLRWAIKHAKDSSRKASDYISVALQLIASGSQVADVLLEHLAQDSGGEDSEKAYMEDRPLYGDRVIRKRGGGDYV
jgi:hypothetical protein